MSLQKLSMIPCFTGNIQFLQHRSRLPFQAKPLGWSISYCLVVVVLVELVEVVAEATCMKGL